MDNQRNVNCCMSVANVGLVSIVQGSAKLQIGQRMRVIVIHVFVSILQMYSKARRIGNHSKDRDLFPL